MRAAASQTALTGALARPIPNPLLRPSAAVGRGAAHRSGRRLGGGRARSRRLVGLGRPRPRPLAVAHLRGLRLAAPRADPGARRRRAQSAARRRAAAGRSSSSCRATRPSGPTSWGRACSCRSSWPSPTRRSAVTRSSSWALSRDSCSAGCAAAVRLRRGPRRSRTAAAPAVDPTTGFYTQIAPAAAPARRARRRRGRPPAAGARLRAPRPLPRPARLQRAAGQRGRGADRGAAPQAHPRPRRPGLPPAPPTRWPSRCASTTRARLAPGRRRPATKSPAG